MRKLSKEEIARNNVDTISQYKILEYLKKHLQIDEFKVFLVDNNNVKIVDKHDDVLYFSYAKDKQEVIYSDKAITYENANDISLC